MVDALIEDIQWLGYQTISLRSDNEPAIVNLLKHALTEARLKVVDLIQIQEEHPNSYDSRGNGEIEAAVIQVTKVLATNKLDLERRISMKILQPHHVGSWLIACAAWMITVRVVGPDGRTAYKRIKHRTYIKRLVPFEEVVQAYLQPRALSAWPEGPSMLAPRLVLSWDMRRSHIPTSCVGTEVSTPSDRSTDYRYQIFGRPKSCRKST